MLSSKHESVSFQPGCQSATVFFQTRITVESQWWQKQYLLLPSKRFPFVIALHIFESQFKRCFLQMFSAFHFSHWQQLSKHSRNHLGRSRSSAAFHSRILYTVCLLLWLHLDAISIPLSATSVLRGCSSIHCFYDGGALSGTSLKVCLFPQDSFILWKAFMIFFAWSVLSLKRLKCQLRLFWTLPHSALLFSLKHVWVIWRSAECRLCAQQLLLKGSGAQWRASLGLLSFSFVATLSDHTLEGYLGPWAR